VIVVPCGGGGLLAGISLAAKVRTNRHVAVCERTNPPCTCQCAQRASVCVVCARGRGVP
jgi:threonine dehydratase